MTECILGGGFIVCAVRDNDISPLGDGVNTVGFKSSPRSRAFGSCVFCTILQLGYVMSIIGGIVLAIFLFPAYGLAVIIVSVVILIIYSSIEIVVMIYMKDTEVLLDFNTKKVTVKTQNSSFCKCFGGITREFSLDDVLAFEEKANEILCNDQRFGIIIRTMDSGSYTPTRASFTILELNHLQQALQRYKSGAPAYNYAPPPPLGYQTGYVQPSQDYLPQPQQQQLAYPTYQQGYAPPTLPPPPPPPPSDGGSNTNKQYYYPPQQLQQQQHDLAYAPPANQQNNGGLVGYYYFPPPQPVTGTGTGTGTGTLVPPYPVSGTGNGGGGQQQQMNIVGGVVQVNLDPGYNTQ